VITLILVAKYSKLNPEKALFLALIFPILNSYVHLYDYVGILLIAIRYITLKRFESSILMLPFLFLFPLSKNLFLSAEQSYIRKAQEIIITGMLEIVLSKKRILEIYLNVAEWGVGIFGIEAAARHYFGISAAQLSPHQAAWLAAILPAPRKFDQLRNSTIATQKANIILYRMRMVNVP
jgi:hypothetical protein